MEFLQMSFYGAVLILVIVVLRAAALNYLPKKMFLVLWGLALFRLLVPISVPSAWSIYSLIGQKEVTVLHDKMPADGLADSGMLAVREGMPAGSGWFFIWCMGAVLCAAFFAVTYFRCRNEFRASLPVENSFAKRWLKEHTMKRPISVRQSDRVSVPLTYGIFHPVILMPKDTDWENMQQLQYVFLHEYIHICHYDAVWKVVVLLALCIHWFNPVVWVMYVLFNRDIELACDACVVQASGINAKSAYAMALVSMEAKKSGLLPLCNCFSKNVIEERIRAIMKMKKKSRLAVLAAVVLVCGVTVGFATSAKDKTIDKTAIGQEVVAQQPDAGEIEGRVNVDALRVRENADARANVTSLLKLDQKVSILEEKDGFYYIMLHSDEGDMYGYVKKEYVDVNDEGKEFLYFQF